MRKLLITGILILTLIVPLQAADFSDEFNYSSQSEFGLGYWIDSTHNTSGVSLNYDITGGVLKGLTMTSSNPVAYSYYGFEKDFDSPVSGDFVLEMNVSWGNLGSGIAGMRAIFSSLSEIPTAEDKKTFGLGIWGRGAAVDKYTIAYSLNPAVSPTFNADMTRGALIGASNSSAVIKLVRAGDQGSLYWNNQLVITATMTTSDIDVMYIGFTGYCPTYTSGSYSLVDLSFDKITINEQQVLPGSMTATVTENELSEGQITSYTLGLSRSPNSNVNVDVATDGNVLVNLGSGYTDSGTLVFTSSNYSPRTINVKAVDGDGLEVYDQISVISHTATSNDAGFISIGFTDPNMNYDSVPGDLAFYINDADCGAWGYYSTDLDKNCSVDLSDLALIASQWLKSTVPFGGNSQDLLVTCQNQTTGQTYHTLQRAVDTSAAGDTIVIFAGEHEGYTVIPAHDLTITKAAGLSAEDVVLVGPGDAATLLFTHGGSTPNYQVVIDGITITGSRQAITAGAQSAITMKNCIIRDITQVTGTADDLEIVEDFVGEISDCRFINNTAIKAGVIRAYSLGGVIVKRCLFDGNKTGATSRGLIASSLIRVENSVFTNNSCAGIFYYCYSGSEFINNTMYHNTCNYAVLAGNQPVSFYNNIDLSNATRTPIIGSTTYDIAIGSVLEYNIFGNTLNASLSSTNIQYSDIFTLFTDAENGNLTLANGSPAINAGNSSVAPEDDFSGSLRDSQVDIGAFEK